MFRKQYIIPLLSLLCVFALIIVGPIPQDQNYHDFADERKLWGISNFLNVVTNLPFAFVGILGLRIVRKIKERELKHISFILFTGFLLLTIGSSYYHLRPKNDTLVYDRILFRFAVHVNSKTNQCVLCHQPILLFRFLLKKVNHHR